jgi:type IV secretory pathway VirB10-like protein
MNNGPKNPKDLEELSAVFMRDAAHRPQVSQPSSPWTLVLGVGGAAVLGVVVFTSLSSARSAHASAAATTPAVGAPAPAWQSGLNAMAQQSAAPPLAAPSNPLPGPQAPPPPPRPIDPDPSEPHWRAPAVVVDLSEATPQAPAAARLLAQAGVAPMAPGAQPADGPSAEERFAARVSGVTADTARATQMRDVARIVPQGFVIPAVLETAIDSDLPGSVRAVVSRDVRGFDGSQVLIPRGSKLIGQYKSAAAVGQTRAFVVWSRIITPTGISIDVGSPATDRLGRGGLAGKADTHFFERFGSAILLSVVSGGVDALSRGGSNNTALVIGSPAQAQNVAAIALQKNIDIPTTIKVAQGAPVQVSVARDLDFSGVVSR